MPQNGLNVKLLFLDVWDSLIESIKSCQHRAWFATYVINIHWFRKWKKTTKFYNFVSLAHKRGVDVRFIIDAPKRNRPNWNVNNFSVNLLKSEKIPVKMPINQKTLHSKVAIFDDDCCYIGSHNLTDGSLNNPFEVTVKIDGHEITQDLILWYQRQWDLLCEDWRVIF